MDRKKVGIFVCVYHNIDKFKRCMDSLLESDLSNHDVAIFVGFNGGYEDAETYVRGLGDMINLHTPIKFHVVKPHANIGKGKLINLMSSYCKNLDYLVSVDGDIEFINREWLDEFIESYELLSKKHKIGALAPEQLGHGCHIFDKNSTCEVLENGTHFVYREDNSTAGALFFIPIAVWKEVNGYKGHRIYASDDGHLCYDVKQKGYRVGMIPEICIHHPFEEDEKYREWKHKVSFDKLTNTKGYYEDKEKI